jgi:hypothetical protein
MESVNYKTFPGDMLAIGGSDRAGELYLHVVISETFDERHCVLNESKMMSLTLKFYGFTTVYES